MSRLSVYVLAGVFPLVAGAADADLILSGGKVLTVDSAFSISEAVAAKGGRIVAVGRTADILARERGPHTKVVDLMGRTVVPGLTDAHVHALGAALSEVREPVPVLHSYAEIQNYIREKAKTTPKGEWIMVPKTFPTRLREMRMPTRDVLDAAPDHPVFYDASYASGVNSYALKMSGITRDTPDPPGSRILRDKNREPVGILTRGATALLKGVPRERAFTEQEKLDALERMLQRYAAAGLTTVGDRGVNTESFELYSKLKEQGRLPVRVVMTARLGGRGGADAMVREIERSTWLTGKGDERLKFGSFKVGLDGGMNAGTAYMREPYGSFQSELFGIDDPENRGELFIPPGQLLTIMRAARDKGWQLSAHSQGGGAVDTLLHVFETLNGERPIAASRSHLIHASFQSPESIALAKRLGVLVDVQPDWLHFDGVALKKVMSPQAMRYFIPLRSLADAGIMFAGGTDHMVGWDKNTAVNAYNPFLGMWIAITRKTVQGEVIHPEERLDRQQALKMYTIWAAYLQHSERERGSIEPGKLADLVVIDRDYLTCSEDDIKGIEPVMTIVGGEVVYGGSAGSLKVERTDRVGRKIENQYFIADLSHRTIKGQEEDSGTLRALTFKPFGLTLLRTENRMHWAPNLSRGGGYSGLGTWQPVQEFREERKADEFIHHREGHFQDYPEVKVEAEYRFLADVPYFLFWSRLTVEKPLSVRLLRNNEMTMDEAFTHLAWPSRDGTRHVTTFEERYPLLEKEAIAFDAPWLAFLNLEKGYGYGFVMLECRATKTVNPGTGISDGARNGKYWSRRLIGGAETPLVAGDRFEERSAYVLFRCSKEKPLDEFFNWEKQIRQRAGGAAAK